MPPSGFCEVQADLIVEFLKSCTDALVLESMNSGATPLQALEKERAHIQSYVSDGCHPLAEGILHLVEGYYSEVVAKGPVTFEELRDRGCCVLEQARQIVLGIRVPQ